MYYSVHNRQDARCHTKELHGRCWQLFMMGASLKGAAAGAVGVLAMDIATWWMYRGEDARRLEREKQARPLGKDPAHVAARKIASLFGSDAAQDEPNAAGIGMHYALGMVPGAAYAKVRRAQPSVAAGGGAVYGLSLFLLNDEIANRVLGLSGPPRAYPWQAHVRGVVGHVVLGVVTEATLKALED